MSHKNKISVVVLGCEESLKKALITNILGKVLPQKIHVLKNTEIYENDTFVITLTPVFYRACEDIRQLYAINRHPDMSLLMVKEGFSAEEVWKQIDTLQKATGKPTEEFIVVLPLNYKHADYPFRFYTIAELFSELGRLAEDRHLMPTNRNADHLKLTLHTPMEKGNVPATKVNLILVGMAGTGKSASGNTILGQTIFTSRPSSNLITTECHVAETVIGGRHVRVIDTPDIFDDEIEPSVKALNVRQCKELCQPGPCVFLLVMHVSRFTDGERDILKKLETAFGSRVHEQTVILFTREQDLKHGEISFDDFLLSCSPDLQKIITKCGSRCVLFENNASHSHQVERLMKTVDEMFK